MIPIAIAVVASLLSSSAPTTQTGGPPPPFNPTRTQVAQADLFMALAKGDLNGVGTALKSGANPNDADFIEEMPLFFANDVPTAKLLLHHGADLNAVTGKGSAVTTALLGGNDSVAQFLLRHNAAVSATRGDKMSLTMAAALNGTLPTLRLLISRHADVNAVDREGTTPLMFAVRGNQLQAARILLSAGARISAKDNHKRTALHYAAMRGNTDMVRLLVSEGASTTAKDVTGETPLHLAAKYSGDPNTVRALLDLTRRPNSKDLSGRTAGDLAARYSSEAVASCFGKSCSTPTAVRQRTADSAIRPAVQRIQTSLATFVQRAACVSCHHQGLGATVLLQAAQHRYAIDKSVIGECFKQMEDDGKLDAPATHAAVQDSKWVKMLPAVHLGDQVFGGAYILGALRAAGVPANPGFGEGVTIMGRLQQPDGRFNSIRRGIMEHSDVMTTGLTLGVLKTYWPADRQDELQNIQSKAKKWAMSTTITCAEDLAGRLLVLTNAEGDSAAIQTTAASLLSAQRPDGGWGTPQRKVSDSYTTGVCLYALRTAAKLAPADAHLKHAVAFLVRTQEDDGSWYEPKLTPAYNNHFDSSFPFGYDQYASFAGTCWATIGLLAMTP
ncbi:MAG: ankyrin repeat domain-containing protein [Fimbriimonas sp.]|nr:ankyrin repeat domain-containing protein [Fimbriimonas sp.]